jgi:hypothetical protein
VVKNSGLDAAAARITYSIEPMLVAVVQEGINSAMCAGLKEDANRLGSVLGGDRPDE